LEEAANDIDDETFRKKDYAGSRWNDPEWCVEFLETDFGLTLDGPANKKVTGLMGKMGEIRVPAWGMGNFGTLDLGLVLISV